VVYAVKLFVCSVLDSIVTNLCFFPGSEAARAVDGIC